MTASEAKKAYMKAYWQEYKMRPEYIERMRLRALTARKTSAKPSACADETRKERQRRYSRAYYRRHKKQNNPEMIARQRAQEAYNKVYAEEKARLQPARLCGLCVRPAMRHSPFCSECSPKWRVLQKTFNRSRSRRRHAGKEYQYRTFSEAVSDIAQHTVRRPRE